MTKTKQNLRRTPDPENQFSIQHDLSVGLSSVYNMTCLVVLSTVSMTGLLFCLQYDLSVLSTV